MKGTWDGDRDPLVALRRGDPVLFESFVRTETETILGFFVRRGAERGEAEDLAQEVLVKLYRSASTYEPRQRFASYALRVARNAWIDRRRRLALQGASDSLDASNDGTGRDSLLRRLAAPGRDVTSVVALAEDKRRLVAALETLPAGHRRVFEFAVLQRRPYAEISATLGIPVGTVKSRVFNALRKLRVELEREETP